MRVAAYGSSFAASARAAATGGDDVGLAGAAAAMEICTETIESVLGLKTTDAVRD